MPAFLGGPAWPELDARLARHGFPGALQLAEKCTDVDVAERQLVIGICYWVHDSPRVANGWFARARSLVADQPERIEHTLAALPLPGCDIIDVSVLRDNATGALALARRLGDRNLEAKALGDLGTATVSLALVEGGMTLTKLRLRSRAEAAVYAASLEMVATHTGGAQ